MAKKNFLKEVYNQKNSIFIKIFMPTIAVMLLQAVLIGVVLMVNGTLKSMDDSATESLYKNSENRIITLQNMMVHTWSNIDRLELDISERASEYMIANNLSHNDVFGVSEREKELLFSISESLIYTMRTTSATGVFAFFIDEQVPASDSATLNGLYFRDFNPIMNSGDYSDIQLEKGPAAIAQQSGIPLSSLWSEVYKIKSEHNATWESIFAPYQAAIDNPELAATDNALWSDAHYIEPDSKIDSNSCISYTRPLFFDGELIGVIGVEIQIEYMEKYFPSSDIGEMGGYMLLQYRNDGDNIGNIDCMVSAVTGSYIKRLADNGASITLEQTAEPNIYKVKSDRFETSSFAMQTMKLYNSNAPFSDRQWGLAAIMPDSILFENSAKTRSGVISSSAISLVLGFILMLIFVRMSTKPLLSIASQIEHGNPDDLVGVKNSKTYEINLLCDTINEMKRKRKDIEIALREEGERYLLALESAIDAFIEYDIPNDRLRIYFFVEDNEDALKQQLTYHVIDGFRRNAGNDSICHPSDMREFESVLCGTRSEACQMRIRADVFSHITDIPSDDGYYWFSFKAIQIRSDSDILEKTIGSAKEITDEKLKEFALIETSRRDLTTNAYNREYGKMIISGQTESVIDMSKDCCILAIVVNNFNEIEAYYGRIFGAIVLRELSSRILSLNPDIYGLIRWGNAEFTMFCFESEIDRVIISLRKIHDTIYIGENETLLPAVNIGISTCHGGIIDELDAERALAAAYSCENTGFNLKFANEQSIPVSTMKSASSAYTGIDISKESIVGLTFSLFEHTNDIKSVINMLLRLLGGLFTLDKIIICEYDEDFGSNQVVYQWAVDGSKKYSSDMERTQHTDFVDLTERLDARGLLMYDTNSSKPLSNGVQKLLCIPDNTKFAALCCAMYENGRQTGRMVFISMNENHKPTETDMFILYEVTKIISTRFNLEKSNSASRAKSEFLSKMSHEIRTPMNAIIGLTRMAKEADHNPEQVRNSLDKIDLSAKHLLSLINDILDMSRIESGKLKIEKRPFSVSDAVSNIETLMRPQFEDKGINFIISREISHIHLEGDDQKLCQVIINLLSNACKFTPQGGEVVLHISQELENNGDTCKCLFSVKDNGVGISEEDHFNIFNAFEQSAEGNQEAGNPRGTGLGLAISNNFVSAMGGRIELKSAKGVGSEFYFTLQFKCGADPDQSSNDSEAGILEDRFSGKRVLIVDDNEINLEIAVFLVEEIGFETEIAKDGKEAVDKFLASEPGYYDAIFMDINMPVMDGFTATREIRKRVERPDSRSIPIIAMTANAFSEDSVKSVEAGMNAHVAKPIDVDYLYTTLDKLL